MTGYNSTSLPTIRTPYQYTIDARLYLGMYCCVRFGRAGFPDFGLTDADGYAGPELGFVCGLDPAADDGVRRCGGAGRPGSVKAVSLDGFRAVLTMAGAGRVSALLTHPG